MIRLGYVQQVFGFDQDQVGSWAALLDQELGEGLEPEFFARLVVLRFLLDYLDETQALVFLKKLGRAPTILSIVNQQLLVCGGGEEQWDLAKGRRLEQPYTGPVYTSLAINVQQFTDAAMDDADRLQSAGRPADGAAPEQSAPVG